MVALPSALNTRSIADRAFDALIWFLGVASVLLVAYPLYFMIIASFSDPGAVAGGHVWLLPKGITTRGYQLIMEDSRIWTGYRNTILYTVLGTAVNLIFTLPAGYALSRKDFTPRNALMFFFVFTMFFNGGLIPTYLLMRSLRLLDTVWVMVIPFSVNVFNLIIVRTFFDRSIPQELHDAARIDGCSDVRFFVSVVLPLSKAIVSVIGLYYAVGHWNEFFRALIYLRSARLQPLQIILRAILVMGQAFEGSSAEGVASMQNLYDLIKYGVIIVSTVPIMAVYPFIQKYFTKGVMIGAIKG